jgi:hypothetical protein
VMLNRSVLWEILWSSAWMWENHREAVQEAFPSIRRVQEVFPNRPTLPAIPGSLWIRKTQR